MKRDDKQWIQQLQSGDARAFARFVDSYGVRVHALARRYANSEAESEDLTQEIFVELSGAIGGFRGDAALSTWVYRIAMNRCLRHQSRRQPDNLSLEDLPIADETQDPARRVVQTELKNRVDDALRMLSPGHREAVVLHEMHGLTYAECADILGIPVGTVKSRLFHAFGRLRERLIGYVSGEDTPITHSTNSDTNLPHRAASVLKENPL